MARVNILPWIGLGLAAIVPLTVSAQAAPIGASSFALDLLDANEIKVIRPGSVGSLLSESKLLGDDGRLSPGTGLEATPWSLWAGGGMTHDELRKKPATYHLSRGSLSVATVADPAVAGGVRSAAALRIRLWDDADWRLNDMAIACARQVVDPPRAGDSPPPLGVSATGPLTKTELERLEKCLARKSERDGGQGAFGVGVVGRSATGEVSAMAFDGVHGWAAFGNGGKTFQWAVSARYSFMTAGPDGSESAQSARGHRLGLGLLASVRAGDVLAVNAELAGGGRSREDDFKWMYSFTGTLLLNVSRGVWLEAQLSGENTGGSANFAGTGGLRWTFDLQPRGG